MSLNTTLLKESDSFLILFYSCCRSFKKPYEPWLFTVFMGDIAVALADRKPWPNGLQGPVSKGEWKPNDVIRRFWRRMMMRDAPVKQEQMARQMTRPSGNNMRAHWQCRNVCVMCVWVCVYVQWGKKVFDPLLILYVCPLTKKWSVYNFNGRFIWTVRDRITTKKSRKTHVKDVINWFAF